MKTPAVEVEFGILEKQSLSERIAARLLSLIKERQLRPGDKLPPERDLATMMHVSRPSLREALRALSIMGIIENQRGSGTSVAALEPARLIEHLDLILSLDDPTLVDLLEARRIVEVGLSGLAAERITQPEIEQLRQCLAQSKASVGDSDRFLESDLEIHQRIAEAARNRILSVLMMTVNKLNVYSRKRTGEDADVRRRSLADHRRIIDALASHDVEAAKKTMASHLDYVETALRHLIQAEEAGPRPQPSGHKDG